MKKGALDRRPIFIMSLEPWQRDRCLLGRREKNFQDWPYQTVPRASTFSTRVTTPSL